MQDLGDTGRCVLCRKHMLLRPGLVDLRHLEQAGDAGRNKISPGRATLLRGNTDTVSGCLPVSSILILQTRSEWLHDVVLVVPGLGAAELQHIVHDA